MLKILLNSETGHISYEMWVGSWISWRQELQSLFLTVSLLLCVYYSYTAQLPFAKSFKSQSRLLQNILLSIYCFCCFCFSSPTASSLPHDDNVKPQLLQHKQKQKINRLTFWGKRICFEKNIILMLFTKKKKYILMHYTQATANNWAKPENYAHQTFTSTLKTIRITTSYWVPQNVKSAQFPQHLRAENER